MTIWWKLLILIGAAVAVFLFLFARLVWGGIKDPQQ